MSAWRNKQLLYNAESTFNQFAESGTATFVSNHAVLSVEEDFVHDQIPDAAHQARLPVKVPGHPGAREGGLKITYPLIGHQATAAGSLTATYVFTAIARALGGSRTTANGTTVLGVTDADTFTLTTVGSWTANTVGRIGVKGDARGDGQGLVLQSDSGQWVMAAPAAPSPGDAIYGTLQAYHDESAAVSTDRFLVMHADTGAQNLYTGCAPTGLEFRFPIGTGELPSVTVSHAAAYCRRMATTFPDTTAHGNHNLAPIAGGSLVMQDVGTTTRNTETPSEVTLTIDLAVQPIRGPGSAGTYGTITGWAKTGFSARCRMKIPYETTYETWWDTANETRAYKYLLFTGSATDGRAIGFWMPRTFPIGRRPTAPVDVNGMTYIDFEVEATESTSTVSEETRASFKFWMG